MSLALLDNCIKTELAAVERLFMAELGSDLACVNALVMHVARFRGKMLRPTLVLLSGDVPLLTAGTLRRLVDTHRAATAAATAGPTVNSPIRRRKNGVATQTLDDQLTSFTTKTSKALEDLGALSGQFATHGKALAEAARENGLKF